MNNKSIRIILALLIIVLSVNSIPRQKTSATPSSYTIPSLTPSWTTGIISDNVGALGIVVTDLDQDGKVDIATCSDGYAYTLNYELDGTYNTTWFSEYLQCLSISSGDRDSDGISELYVATEDGRVLLFNGVSHALIGSFTLPGSMLAYGIAVGDVDEDTLQEIVLATPDSTLVYDANNFNLQWQAIGLGGYQVGIGNIDNDSLNEIIVNGNPGHVLNAKFKSQKWAYSGGFGTRMDVGDVDGDNRYEIAFVSSFQNINVLEGDTQTFRWQKSGLFDVEEITVADFDKNGVSDVITGDGQWGSVTGYQGTDGAYQWAIPNPEHGVFGIGVGDTNNDSINEIVWGAGLSSSGKDALFVGSWINQAVDWGSDDLDGPLYIAANDIDLDGQGEFVLASMSTTSGYQGGTIRVYNGLTNQVEWSTLIGDSYYDIYQLDVGQLDADPALEIIAGGDNWYETRFTSYDGLTHSAEWTSPGISIGSLRELELKDLDNDAVEEIIVGLGQYVQVYHGASNIIQWESGQLDSLIKDLAVGDVDGDGIIDIGVLTYQSVYVFDSSTWTEKLHRAMTTGENLAIKQADLQSPGSLVMVVSDGSSNKLLQALSGPGFPVIWQRSIGDVLIKELDSVDVDSDEILELILLGSDGANGSAHSVLWIASHDNPLFWEFKLKGDWGSINSMALSELDADGQPEFLFGSSSLIQVDEITVSSIEVYSAILPMVARACIPIFSDDFSNAGSGWPNEDAGNVLFSYDNNEYRILIRPGNYGAGARPGIQATDYRVGVDVRNQTGTQGSYGLVFGLSQDWSTFYTLEIYPEGWFGIYRYNYNSITTLAENYSPFIHQGTATNKIEIERNGAQINAYANGNLLTSLSDNLFMGTRYIGLISFSYDQPNLDVRYDNFVVNPLICSGANASTPSTDNWQLLPGYDNFYDTLPVKMYPGEP